MKKTIAIITLALFIILSWVIYTRRQSISVAPPAPIVVTVTPYRVDSVEGKLIATFQLTAKSPNISEMCVTTDQLLTCNWQPFLEFVKIPQVDLGESGNIYIKFKDDRGQESEIFSDTTNPAGPPNQ